MELVSVEFMIGKAALCMVCWWGFELVVESGCVSGSQSEVQGPPLFLDGVQGNRYGGS